MAKKLQQAKNQLLKYGIMVDRIETDAEDFLYSFTTNPLSYIMLHLEQREYLPKLKALLETLSDEDLCFRGENAIMWAAAGALSFEKLLLLKDCKADFVSKHIHDKGHGGRTALHYAAGNCDDNGDTIRLLVEWGTDADARDDGLWTPLHELALCGQSYGASWAALIDCGADPSLREENGATADENVKCGIPIPDEWCQVNILNGGEGMGNFKMNDDTGDMLYALCKPHMYGRNKIEFIEKVQISPKVLKQYFNGKRDLSLEHLSRLADACNMEISVFMAKIASVYKTDEEKKREQEEARRQSKIAESKILWEKWEEEKRQKEQERSFREEYQEEAEAARLKEEEKRREKELVEQARTQTKKQLAEYGIADRWEGSISDFTSDSSVCRLRFILKNLDKKECLPKLEELLKTYDGDLTLDGENAIMWAASSAWNCEKLLLLQKYKADFVAEHIGDRGPEGRAVLHYAVAAGDSWAETIALLVEWGADVNAQDDYLFTPLHEAALDNGHCDRRFAALRACGADFSLKTEEGQTAWAIKDYRDALDAW